MSDLRATILANREMPSETIDVPEWGDDTKVKVVGLNARQRLNLMRDCIVYGDDGQPTGQTDLARMFLVLVVQCARDPETGERIFTDADEEALGETAGKGIETVSQVAAKLSGLGSETEDAGPSSSPDTDASTDG